MLGTDIWKIGRMGVWKLEIGKLEFGVWSLEIGHWNSLCSPLYSFSFSFRFSFFSRMRIRMNKRTGEHEHATGF
jgi:hypothetical protein